MMRALLCIAALVAAGAAMALPQSRPPIVHFSPDVETYPQNFAIEMDGHGNVYLGNMEGVLIFDGSSWHHVPMSNGELVRWLRFDGGERIYVGGYDLFGYITRTENGVYEYRELSSLYSGLLGEGEEFADIWDILVTPAGDVYFVALEHLFRFSPTDETVALWRYEGRFGPIAWYRDTVYLQFRNDAVRKLEGDQWVDVPETDGFRHRLTAMVPVGDELVLLSSDEGFLVTRDGEVISEVQFDAAPTITHVTWLGGNELVLASQLGELYFYDLSTNEYEVVKVSDGFVTAVTRTGSGEVLVVDDTGFYSVRWPTRWRTINSDAGLIGSVHAVRHSDEDIFVLTTSGIFHAGPGDESFTRLDWTDNEAWDMLLLDDGSVLVAESYELVLIDGDRRVSITGKDNTPRSLLQSPYDPDIVYVGTELGIQVLRRSGDTWELVYRNDDMGTPVVWMMFEIAPQTVLAGTDRAGIQALNFVPGDQWKMTSRLMDSSDGIEYASEIPSGYLYQLPQGIIAGTDAGYYLWNGTSFEADDVMGLAALSEEFYFDLAASGDNIWAFDYRTLMRYDGEWRVEDIASLKHLALTVVHFVGDQVLVGDESALHVFEERQIPDTSTPRSIQVTRAEHWFPDERRHPLSIAELASLEPGGRIAFQFSMPEFRRPQAVRYRMRLLPVDVDFSDWSESSRISLGELDAGAYELLVEARDGFGRISSMSLALNVNPRWYESMPMMVAWVTLSVVAFILLQRTLVQLRSRQLERERDRLELMVTERTRALESANRQLEQMAHLDSLTQIPNRRRLDHYLEDVWKQCVERGRVMSIALIDVDHFKNYNDTHGHVAGDELLIELARLLSRNLRRAEDLVARYGGEEFLVVLPGAEPNTAWNVVEGMRASVANSSLGVTVSGGICSTGPDSEKTVTDLIEEADAALYRAKSSGRNQVIPSDNLPLAGL